jgi:RNA polymerase sigma-70 factor (sigma-E family)
MLTAGRVTVGPRTAPGATFGADRARPGCRAAPSYSSVCGWYSAVSVRPHSGDKAVTPLLGLGAGGPRCSSVAGVGTPAGRASGISESEVERTLGTLASMNPIYAEVAHDAAPDPSSTGAVDGAAPVTIDDLYRSHRMGMVRLAILLVDDLQSAEDVVQEAFAGLYKNWSSLRDRRAAIGYLRMAVVNGSRSMLRRRRTARAYVPPDAGTARSAESLAMMSAEHQAVVVALAELPERQREVLVLRYYGGLSEAEIAEATGLARGTVKSTASRAIAKLTEAMESMRTGQ